ncbi:MAG: hypothetical protein HKN17_06165 [Rhodothermales bacterium]|nr:hypothetical protein [Rhodothermales bacterium]
MAFSFSQSDIERIESVLGVKAKMDGTTARFELEHDKSGRAITLEIHARVDVPGSDEPGNLISVYAASSFLQLQQCTGFIASKELGEVIFVAHSGDAANGLVVEREAGCSVYANVDKEYLSMDFTQLPPELIMSSVALSVAENLFDDLG